MRITDFKIDNTTIGLNQPPYVIAEISANHNGSIKNAMKIIDLAKRAGANAVKMQTYTPDTITLKSDLPEFQITDGLWEGRTLYDLYEWAHTPWSWHKDLFDYARDIGITMFSTPFDFTAVDLLESLNAPAYKVASFEVIDIPLIKYIASTKKPMIISTGMANLEEIHEAVDAALSAGASGVAVLHCVSGYPAPASEYNLKTLPDMQSRLQVPVGLSDHTIENTTAIASVTLGSSVIEKHVTLDRDGGGPDDSFSLEEDELAALCRDAKTAWQALGNVNYERTASELGNIKFRRSLYFVKDLEIGDVITEDCIRSVRPGYGISPKHFDKVVGTTVKRRVSANSPVVPDALDSSILV